MPEVGDGFVGFDGDLRCFESVGDGGHWRATVDYSFEEVIDHCGIEITSRTGLMDAVLVSDHCSLGEEIEFDDAFFTDQIELDVAPCRSIGGSAPGGIDGGKLSTLVVDGDHRSVIEVTGVVVISGLSLDLGGVRLKYSSEEISNMNNVVNHGSSSAEGWVGEPTEGAFSLVRGVSGEEFADIPFFDAGEGIFEVWREWARESSCKGEGGVFDEFSNLPGMICVRGDGFFAENVFAGSDCGGDMIAMVHIFAGDGNRVNLIEEGVEFRC